MHTLTITATVFYENNFWVGMFERQDDSGYHVAKHIFGAEPTDPELYEFVLKNYQLLRFTESIKDFRLIVKRQKFKRMQREVRHELKKQEKGSAISHAQEVLRLELEKNKKIKKTISKEEKEAQAEAKFLLKQQKKKQKKRGH